MSTDPSPPMSAALFSIARYDHLMKCYYNVYFSHSLVRKCFVAPKERTFASARNGFLYFGKWMSLPNGIG